MMSLMWQINYWRRLFKIGFPPIWKRIGQLGIVSMPLDMCVAMYDTSEAQPNHNQNLNHK